MIIYADDKNYAKQIFPGLDFQILDDKHNISLDNKIFRKILPSATIFQSELKENSDWKFVFISKNSQQSQFDLLFNVSKSTNDLPDGILCLADSGSKFHGYRSREWEAKSGNLHLSIYLSPQKQIENFYIGLMILSTVSIIQTLDMIPYFKGKPWIKWVNDIFVNNAKLGGVITQTQTMGSKVTGVFLGIGLNIISSPDIQSNSFINKTTCISEYVDNMENYNINFIFNNLISFIHQNYNELMSNGYEKLLQFYKERTRLIGKNIEIFSDPIEGKSELIAHGKLLDIGKNLELYIENFEKPITQGRLVLKQ